MGGSCHPDNTGLSLDSASGVRSEASRCTGRGRGSLDRSLSICASTRTDVHLSLPSSRRSCRIPWYPRFAAYQPEMALLGFVDYLRIYYLLPRTLNMVSFAEKTRSNSARKSRSRG